MRSVKSMKAAKIGYVISSLLFCLLGILLMVYPDLMVPVIAGVFGALSILFGIVKVIGYFSKDLFRLAFQYDLAIGLLLITIGIITIFKTENVMAFVSIVLGLYVLTDGLLKIQIALDSKAFGIRQWWLIFIAAILTGIIGGILVIRPFKGAKMLIALAGGCLLAEGLLSLITVLTAVRIIKHQRPDRIDTIDLQM